MIGLCASQAISRRNFICVAVIAFLLSQLTVTQVSSAQTPVGGAIYYSRGDLRLNNNLLNGTYDLRFLLYNAPTAGTVIAPILTRTGVHISGGKLGTQALDFGDGAFNGDARWIEVKARQGNNNYAVAGSRQRFRPAPYALALPGFYTIPAEPYGANIIGGSKENSVAPGIYSATISGGGSSDYPNTITASYGTIAGGSDNHVTGGYSTVSGGGINTAAGAAAVVGGGSGNNAGGNYSIVPGGTICSANGHYSFAAGLRAQANHNGSFVWSDAAAAYLPGAPTYLTSSADHQFTVRAAGGTRFFSNAATNVGVQLAAGGNSWSAISDRNVKCNFSDVDSREILNKIAKLSITRWNLISQDESIKHIGPMAQDFFAAFDVGEDDRHITQTDADGVLFAAVQGLNQAISEKDREINELKQRLAALEAAMQKLELAQMQNKSTSKGDNQ